jgi:peptidoglycan pentaglycine glycine transferase (the first glycine)
MLANYSAERAAQDATAQMALLLAEYEGEPIAGSTIAILGAWGWNLHSGSSGQSEHRKLRPNYLLQWECMRWVKAHGGEHYDWRTIPDVLEPGEELYGVYEFKRGFGGEVRRVMPTQDLPLRPALYWPYVGLVSLRRAQQKRKRAAFEQRRQAKLTAARGAPATPTDATATSSDTTDNTKAGAR